MLLKEMELPIQVQSLAAIHNEPNEDRMLTEARCAMKRDEDAVSHVLQDVQNQLRDLDLEVIKINEQQTQQMTGYDPCWKRPPSAASTAINFQLCKHQPHRVQRR